MSETRADLLVKGRLQLRQPKTGHRAGTDAVLVAAASSPQPGDMLVDAGSGVGTIGLMLALRVPTLRVRLLEREAVLAGLARDNVVLNALEDRVTVLGIDVLCRDAVRPLLADADHVVSNPPFFAPGVIRASPDPLKARAHRLDPTPCPEDERGGWLRAVLRLARPHGRVVLLQRPEALPALLAAAEGRMGGIRVRPVLPRSGQPAIRILVGGVVGSRAPLSILDALVLHDDEGGFTPLAQAMARGEAPQPLLDGPARKSRPRGPAVP